MPLQSDNLHNVVVTPDLMIRILEAVGKSGNQELYDDLVERSSKTPLTDAYAEALGGMNLDEGDYDFDQDPDVSPGDDPGAYVQIWAWVPDTELPEEFQEKKETDETKD